MGKIKFIEMNFAHMWFYTYCDDNALVKCKEGNILQGRQVRFSSRK